jgi:hypothetical protein
MNLDTPMRMPICHCARCHSRNTIRVDAELLREHWYCYACGHGFDVPVEDTGHRIADRRSQSASTVSSRLNGSGDVGTRSLGVK